MVRSGTGAYSHGGGSVRHGTGMASTWAGHWADASQPMSVRSSASFTVQVLRNATGIRGADVVVDVTANAPSALGQAVDLAAVGGRIVLAGTRNSTETPGFRPDVVIYKELRLIGALGVDTAAYRQALDLVARDQYPFRSVTRRLAPLDEADGLLSTMAGESDGALPVHAVLAPWEGR